MRNSPEYIIYKQLATYLRLQYPNVLFHFDLTGVNMSKAAAGKNKAIQHSRGWPDLFIAKPIGRYHGLFLEIKPEGTRLLNKNNQIATNHIKEQWAMLQRLEGLQYLARFAVGFDEAKSIIDEYMLDNL